MQSLACNVFLSDLTLEFDAVVARLGPVDPRGHATATTGMAGTPRRGDSPLAGG
jgi:hypothetical protein